MKLYFKVLNINDSKFKVSFDDGISWRTINVEDLGEDKVLEFSEDDCPDLTKIKIRGRFKTFKDIDVLYDPETFINVVEPSEDVPSSKAVVDYVNKSINELDVSNVGSSGSYIKTIGEEDGKVIATTQTFDTTLLPTSTNENAPTTKVVYDATKKLSDDLSALSSRVDSLETTIPINPTEEPTKVGSIWISTN